jgi:hypothetical protein
MSAQQFRLGLTAHGRRTDNTGQSRYASAATKLLDYIRVAVSGLCKLASFKNPSTTPTPGVYSAYIEVRRQQDRRTLAARQLPSYRDRTGEGAGQYCKSRAPFVYTAPPVRSNPRG